jgi:hypothetical protein
LLFAVAASVLVHGAFFVWVSTRSEPPDEVPANVPVEFEVVKVESLRPAVPAVAPVLEVKEPVAGKGAARSARERPTKPPLTPAVDADVLSSAPARVPPDAPLAPTGRGDFLVPKARLDLPAEEVWLELPKPTDGPRFAAPPTAKNPQELVERTVADAVGHYRVESGNVPTYFSELRAVLVIAWDVHRVVERRSRTGSSMPRSRTTIRLVQDRTGYLLRAEILAPAQDAEVATEAIADLQRARDGLPRPPPDALGDREQLASTWAFDYVPLPPPVTYPMVFDLVVIIDPKAIPKPTDKKISLQSVE